jgi:hypothetical protein
MANELKYKSFDDLPERIVFTPEQVESGELAAYLEKLQELKPETVELVASDSEPQAGWGVAVIQVSKTQDVKTDEGVKKMRVPTRVLIWPVPTLAALLADAQGSTFVTAAVNKEIAHQIARPFRDTDANADDAKREAPASIIDFATRRANESVFKVFNELASAAIAALKDSPAGKHPFIKRLAKPMFREVLESAAAANAMAPDLENLGLWDKALDMLITYAEAKDLSSQIFHDWKARRTETTTFELGAIDLAGLEMDLGSDDDSAD